MQTSREIASAPHSLETASPAFDDIGNVYWCALLIVGFGYVAVILCGRSLPFSSGNNTWGDFLAVLFSAPALYRLSARHTLWKFGQNRTRALLLNGLLYGGLFFAALHWEEVGRLTGANFSLTTQQLSHLNPNSKIAGAIGLVIFAVLTTLCLREARREGIFRPYLLSFVGLILILTIVTYLLGPGYHVHIHHYFLALCLLPFVRFRFPACFVTQAILAGVYVEGACRWGLDPIWVAGP